MAFWVSSSIVILVMSVVSLHSTSSSTVLVQDQPTPAVHQVGFQPPAAVGPYVPLLWNPYPLPAVGIPQQLHQVQLGDHEAVPPFVAGYVIPVDEPKIGAGVGGDVKKDAATTAKDASSASSASADGPADGVDDAAPSFRAGINLAAKASIAGLGGTTTLKGEAYFYRDIGASGTAATLVVSGFSDASLLVKVGTATDCQNALVADIFNPSSVSDGGIIVRSLTANGAGATRSAFRVERNIPSDVITLSGSRTIIGRTLLVTDAAATNLRGCGVIKSA